MPVEFKAAADTWWEGFMDDKEMPKVGCKPDRPVKVATHKLVPVEETRMMLRGMSIGTHEAADAECSAKAEGIEVLEEKGDSEQRYNGKPPQDENRSATGAYTSYVAAGTVTAALMQTRAVAEGKVANT